MKKLYLLLCLSTILSGEIQRVDMTQKLGLAAGQFAQLMIPDDYRVPANGHLKLVFHFHSATWAAEDIIFKSGINALLFNIHLGALSGSYSTPFADASLFNATLNAIQTEINNLNFGDSVFVDTLIVTSFSAGYGAVREILQTSAYYQKINALILADGLHTASYLPSMDTQMAEFVQFAKDARDHNKIFLLTHSAIPTPGYESTTSTSNYLINKLGSTRQSCNFYDGIGDQTSYYNKGDFRIRGYAGTTADDHMKHLYGINLSIDLLETMWTPDPTGFNNLQPEHTLPRFGTYPNPFNNEITFAFDGLRDELSEIRIYDVCGRQIADLENLHPQEGLLSLQWQAEEFPSGYYIVILYQSEHCVTAGISLIK